MCFSSKVKVQEGESQKKSDSFTTSPDWEINQERIGEKYKTSDHSSIDVVFSLSVCTYFEDKEARNEVEYCQHVLAKILMNCVRGRHYESQERTVAISMSLVGAFV